MNSAKRILYYAALVLMCAHVVLLSWVEEDAFISFRVVDNFVHGFGLRWNINERVQTYTNPLWTLLHIPLYALTGNIILTTCVLGWACLIGTLIVTRRTFEVSPLRYTALFLVSLLVSPTNSLFFTSGLESPLLDFLFVCFGFALIRRPHRYWLWLSLMTALSLWARLDTAIVYAPVWLCLLLQEYKTLRWRDVFLGALPIIGWELFSLFYYGFLLPNTAYAKLGGGLPLEDYLRSGLAYTYDFVLGDPWGAALIGITAAGSVLHLWQYRRDGRTDAQLAFAIAAGIVLYCIYVIFIGGAQFSYRRDSLPVLAASWLWLWRVPVMSDKWYFGCALIAVLTYVLLVMPPEERANIPMVAHARIGTNPRWGPQPLFVDGDYTDWRRALRRTMQQPNHKPHPLVVKGTGVIGRVGFYAGPYVIIVDPLGLGDPLMSRLPAAMPHMTKVGGIARRIPLGYMYAVATGSTKGMNPALAQYYEKLCLITQGNLFDMQRLKTIIEFNLGEFDYLRDQYVNQYLHR